MEYEHPPFPSIEGVEFRIAYGFPGYCVGDDGYHQQDAFIGLYWSHLPGHVPMISSGAVITMETQKIIELRILDGTRQKGISRIV